MRENEMSDEELEKEFEKVCKRNELASNVFKILRDEKSAQELKERKLKKF